MKTNSKNYICRGCGSHRTKDLGKLPLLNSFAGNKLINSLPETHLYECASCALLARYPILSKQAYNKLYAAAAADVWVNQTAMLRPDQEIIHAIITKNYPNGCSVLDIGCYTGSLLASLPDSFQKYGVEISSLAAEITRESHIEIIGHNLYHIDTKQKFDVITVVDVIEHTSNPVDFLLTLKGYLAIDGQIIVSTGNTDNWLWKLLKSRFWYCSFNEHISFIGYNWLNQFAKKYHFECKNIIFLAIKNLA